MSAKCSRSFIKALFRIVARLLVLFFLSLSFHSVVFASQISLLKVSIKGSVFYLVSLSPIDRTYSEDNRAFLYERGFVSSPSGPLDMMEDHSELAGLQEVLFGDVSLLESEDMQKFLGDEGTKWSPFEEDPLADFESLRAYQDHMIDLIYSFGDYNRVKTYEDRKAVPKILSGVYENKVKERLPKGQLAVVVLNEQKNFAGVFSLTLPTASTPKLPSEQVFQELQKQGLIEPHLQLPLLENADEVRPLQKLGGVSGSDFHHGHRYRNEREWRSITGELGTLVRTPHFKEDIFQWGVYALDALNNKSELSEGFVNNGPENEWFRAPSADNPVVTHSTTGVGSYLGVFSSARFRLFRSFGWEKVHTLGDVVFARLTRKKFLSILWPELAETKPFVDPDNFYDIPITDRMAVELGGVDYEKSINVDIDAAVFFNQTLFGPDELNDSYKVLDPIPLSQTLSDIKRSFLKARGENSSARARINHSSALSCKSLI